MDDKIFVARRKNMGIDPETYAKYDWQCYANMQKVKADPNFNADFPFVDIVSFELKDPEIVTAFVVTEPQKPVEDLPWETQLPCPTTQRW